MCKMRLQLTKGENIRYISHLDYASALERAVCRAKLPAAYSEGFNPHMKLSFASALSVGVTSDAEYVDVEWKREISPEEVLRRLGEVLPEGLDARGAMRIVSKQKALSAVLDRAVYEVSFPFEGEMARVETALASFDAADACVFTRRTPKVCKEIDLKAYLGAPIAARAVSGRLFLTLETRITPSGSAKPSEFVRALVETYGLPVVQAEAAVCRKGLYVRGKTPMELG